MRTSLALTTMALAGTMVVPAVADAAADPWSCRASAARATLPAPAPAIEPIRANANGTPCSTQSSAVLQPGPIGPATAGAVGAFTTRAANGASAALASAATASVVLGPLTVSADEVQATASAACSGTTPTLTGTSRVVGLVINGQPAVIPPGDAPFEIPLGPLGSVVGNQEIKDAGAITRRALAVITPQGEVVLAEAFAGARADACKEDVKTAAPPTCPAGATYDAQHNVCVIQRPGTNTHTNTTTTVVVSPPFQGPQGGTVMTLGEARKLTKSPCLRRNKGPKFVIVGTNKNNRIKGTKRADRIILRGGRDRASGGRGGDCIDGGKGRDTLSGGVGKDSLYGKRGNDRLRGGKQADHMSGAGGNDRINAGRGPGRESVQGGKGRDRINVSARGRAAKKLRCGPGRDRIRVNRNERRRAKRGRCNRIVVRR